MVNISYKQWKGGGVFLSLFDDINYNNFFLLSFLSTIPKDRKLFISFFW